MSDPLCKSLDAFLDDELEPTKRDAFQDHIAMCETCAAAIEQQSKIDSSLRAYAECLVPIERKHKSSLKAPMPTNTEKYALALAEACVVAAIGFGIWFSLGRLVQDQKLADQVAQETTQKTAAPPKANQEVDAPSPVVKEKQWEKQKNVLSKIVRSCERNFSKSRRSLTESIRSQKTVPNSWLNRTKSGWIWFKKKHS